MRLVWFLSFAVVIVWVALGFLLLLNSCANEGTPPPPPCPHPRVETPGGGGGDSCDVMEYETDGVRWIRDSDGNFSPILLQDASTRITLK